MNLFTLFFLASPIAGGIGALMAARAQGPPIPFLALCLGLIFGVCVNFGVFGVTALLANAVCRLFKHMGAKASASRPAESAGAVCFVVFVVPLVPVLSGVAAYWLIIQIW